jgi:biopolymer transport protein ExbD
MARHRRPAAYAADVGAPISDLNTTPLIDVMLVLLIMFIVTIPIATHGIKLDLPSSTLPLTEEPETHKLSLDSGGRLFFDGAALPEAGLGDRLRSMKGANPLAALQLQIEGEARYEDFDRILAVVKGVGIERLGFVGNHSFEAAL